MPIIPATLEVEIKACQGKMSGRPQLNKKAGGGMCYEGNLSRKIMVQAILQKNVRPYLEK
jgi:hypothetical protein